MNSNSSSNKHPRPLDSELRLSVITTPVARRLAFIGLMTLSPLLMAVPGSSFGEGAAPAADSSLPPVVARYEQMLIRSPEKGTAFDKIYQHYFEGEGLEKLDARWRGKFKAEEGNKANAASFDLLLGLLSERRGATADARKAYTQATELAPGDFRVWKTLGEFEAGEGKMPAAIEALQKALAAKPPVTERAAIYRKLAQAQQRNLENDAALATWQKMATEFPDDPFVLEEVADAQVDAEKFDDAKATYGRLRDLAGADPFKRVTATIRLAQVEERQGKNKEALAIYESALPQASETSWIHRDVRSRIEEIYRRQDDLPGLVAYYQKWLGAHDKDVEAASRLSGALVELGRQKEAAQWLKKAAEWAPDRREVQVELAKTLRDTGQLDEAVKIVTTLTQSFPDELSYWEMLGETQWQLFLKSKDESKKKAALAAWEKLAPADSKDSTTASHLAELLKAHDLNEEALTQYERAALLAPEAIDLRERWAGFLFELKRDEPAWKVLDALVAGDHPPAANYRRLAAIQNKYGKQEAALETLKKGLAIDPGDFASLSLEWRIRADRKEWEQAAALFEPMLAAAPAMYDQSELQYLQAIHAAGKTGEVRDKLSARLGTASESELRLLARLAAQIDDLPLARKALDEGRKRFASSVSLARMEAEYAKRAGDLPARVAVLRRLISLEPKQANDYLKEIARAYQEQESWDQALAAAQEWITASPASPEAHLFYADLCFAAGKRDQGIAKLKEAIKLSDKPNPVRQRLARAYAETGDLESARQVYEEAFEAEADSSAKLLVLRQLSEIYFQQGKMDALIARFKERQHGEEGGWRYALYLAEIYQQMQDYGQAREELSKALASRPKDPSLLKQLIKLAVDEGNPQEQARFYKTLAEAEPSAENRVGLAQALADSGDTTAAVQVLIENQADLLKDPAPWRGVFTRVQKEGGAKKLSAALEEALRQRPDDFKGRLTLAEMQISLGNFEDAKRILWELRAMPKPVSATTAAAAPTPAPGANPMMAALLGSGNMSSLSLAMRRQNSANIALQTYQQLSAGPQSYNRYSGRRYYSFGGGYASMQQPLTLDTYEGARDTALVYLGSIAMRENKEDAFLGDLEKELDAQNADRMERFLAYSILQAREPLLKEIRKQVETPAKDAELDQLCLNAAQGFSMGAENGTPDPETQEAKKAWEKLSERIAKNNPKQIVQLLMMRHNLLERSGKKEEAKKLFVDWLKKVDEKDDQQLQMAVSIAISTGDLDRAERYGRKLIKSGAGAGNNPRGYYANPQWLYLSLAQGYLQKKDVAGAVRLYTESFKESLPQKAGQPSGPNLNRMMIISGSRMFRSGRYGGYSNQSVPFPNRYIDEQRLQLLRQVLGLLKAPEGVKPFYAALEALDVPDEMKIYPRLAVVYLKWLDGQKEESLKDAMKVLSDDPDDELRLLVAGMLGELKKLPEAIALLNEVTARQGDIYKQTQTLLFADAKKAKDNDNAKKAALRLLALRPTRDEMEQMLPDLKKIGLVEQADQIAKKMAGPATNPRDQNRLVNLLHSYRNQKKETEAVGLAKSMLAQDPLAARRSGNGDYMRRTALDTLKQFDVLDDYISDLEKQFAAAPDSVRICLLIAEALSQKDSKKAVDWYRKALILKPGDTDFKLMLAENLRNRDQEDEALKIYKELLQEDPLMVFDNNRNFVNIFGHAKELPELAGIILKQPASLASSGVLGGNRSPENICNQLGRELKKNKNIDLAVKVWMKGLELMSPNNGNPIELRNLLMDGLIELGRNEEALTQIKAIFFPPDARKTALFGMTRNYNAYSWMNNISSYGNGRIEFPALKALRVAASIGGLADLQKEAEAKSEGNSPIKNLVMMIRINARDPKALTDLPKFLADHLATPQGQGIQFLQVMSQEFDAWPEAKRASIDTLVAAKKSADTNPQNYYQTMGVRLQLAKRALEVGENEIVRTSLKEWLKIAESSQSAGNYGMDQIFPVFWLMVGQNMTPECEKLLALIKNSPQLRGNYRQQIGQIEAEMAMMKGQIDYPQAVAVFGGEEKGKSLVLWEIRNLKNWKHNRNESNESIEMAGKDYPKLDGRYDIEILALTEPNVLQRIALIPKAKARGQWTGVIPEGAGSLMAVLHTAKGKGYEGVWTPYLRTPNLLTNPAFNGLETIASQGRKLAGWQKLPDGRWAIRPGGPQPGGKQVVFESSDNETVQIIGDRIAVEKGTEYFLSGLLMTPYGYSQANIGVRFCDQDGKEIEKSYCARNGNEQGKWCFRSQSLTTAKNTINRQRRIPEKAVFMEPFIEGSSNIAISNLYLGARPIPTDSDSDLDN